MDGITYEPWPHAVIWLCENSTEETSRVQLIFSRRPSMGKWVKIASQRLIKCLERKAYGLAIH